MKTDEDQMPNLHYLMCTLSETITGNGTGKIQFASVDLSTRLAESF